MTGLDERIMMAALRHLAGATYDANATPACGTQDCTRATYAILQDVLGAALKRRHADMHIRDAERPFSNVQALIDLGFAEEVDPFGPLPVGWMLMQGWQSIDPLRKGHAWLWRQSPHIMLDDGFIVQATNKGKWCENRNWLEQRLRFPHVQIAALRQS